MRVQYYKVRYFWVLKHGRASNKFYQVDGFETKYRRGNSPSDELET